MGNYVVPPNTACRFKHGPLNIALFLAPDVSGIGLGFPLVLAVEDADRDEAVIIATIAGPWDIGRWRQETDPAYGGVGMGNFMVGRIPAARAALKKYFDLTPDLPIITNQSPWSLDNFNTMLFEYFEMKQVSPAEGDHPTLDVKPYIPPN